MQTPDYIPENYDRIQVVDDFDSVFSTPDSNDVDCVLFPRRLKGDFNGLACKIAKLYKYELMDTGQRALSYRNFMFSARIAFACAAGYVTPDEKIALRTIREDMRAIKHKGLNPLFLIMTPRAISPITHSFHTDGAKSLITCYTSATTEFIRNEDAYQHIPGDNRYYPSRGARIYNFQAGDLWSHQPGFDRTGFIHRAPTLNHDDAPRILIGLF